MKIVKATEKTYNGESDSRKKKFTHTSRKDQP